jgi:hypothetical protein
MVVVWTFKISSLLSCLPLVAWSEIEVIAWTNCETNSVVMPARDGWHSSAMASIITFHGIDNDFDYEDYAKYAAPHAAPSQKLAKHILCQYKSAQSGMFVFCVNDAWSRLVHVACATPGQLSHQLWLDGCELNRLARSRATQSLAEHHIHQGSVH